MPSSTNDNAALGYLDEPTAGRLTIDYAPADNATPVENPPRFMWLPVVDEQARYVLQISQDANFPVADTLIFSDIRNNFFTPDVQLYNATYHWCYAQWDNTKAEVCSNWSTVRSFTLDKNSSICPLVDRKDRYQFVNKGHPRLWLDDKALTTFKTKVASDNTHCSWDNFFEKSVQPWLERDIMPEPARYPNNTRTAPIWRQTYIDCQELIYAIRHLAVAGSVLDDQSMLDKAKSWLLSAAAWDPEGSTSRSYTDEWAFRVTVALAWGYDWLYEQMDETERKTVRVALLARTRQVADHVIAHANIHLFPYDSHAVRSVSAVLIPACIAMWDEEPEAKEWLDYSIDFLSTVYSPWTDDQGGWAEGPHYWMTGMAYFIEAANLLKSYFSIDLYQRPFLQKTGDFPLYTKAPSTRRATFGDDSTMGDLVCLKVGYNMRQFAGVTGNKAYQWYFEEVKRNDPGTEMMFYNYGWWDLNFDELMYQHDYPIIEAQPPAPEDTLRWFKGTGWAGIQYQPQDPDKSIHFVMKASGFGSISHSHGDQNAFCLAAFGEDLAIQSGHYIAFNSDMHLNWRRQTRSKNAILINGRGQYADKDKMLAMSATGKLNKVEKHSDHIYLQGDATAAYQHFNPSVTKVEREVYYIQDQYFVFVDSIDADEAVDIQWLLHANGEMQLGETSFRYSGEKAGFYGQCVWSEAGKPTMTQETGFPGINPDDYAGLAQSTCLTATYPAAKHHRIVTLLVPYKKSAPKRIYHFLDDQGYDCNLYFTDEQDRSFKVVVQKLAKV